MNKIRIPRPKFMCYVLCFSFYGFCIDVLEKISKKIGFNYILDLVHDKKVSFTKLNFTKWKFIDGVVGSMGRRMPRQANGTVRETA